MGGFAVRRLLPYATHRMVGPFIFFDHMGPAEFPPGQGVNVRPHPHIGLATVTYLFSGKILHRDSLGSFQHIEPGAINWMVAGRGIVHSERTPEELKATGYKMNGIQCWLALPNEHEEAEPQFFHHPSNTLPEFEINNVKFKLLLGDAYQKKSPVKVHSDIFYLQARMPKGSTLELPIDEKPGVVREGAIYIVTGQVQVEDKQVSQCTMVVGQKGKNLKVEALEDTHLMILGGAAVGPRFIWWNLVSSSEERLKEAKKMWKPGPRKDSQRFFPIPGDDQEFIPSPEDSKITPNPKGTIL